MANQCYSGGGYSSGVPCGPSGGVQYGTPQRGHGDMSQISMPTTVDQKLHLKPGQSVMSAEKVAEFVTLNKDGSLTFKAEFNNAPRDLNYSMVFPNGGYTSELYNHNLTQPNGKRKSEGYEIEHVNKGNDTSLSVTIDSNVQAFRISVGEHTFKIDPKEITAIIEGKGKAAAPPPASPATPADPSKSSTTPDKAPDTRKDVAPPVTAPSISPQELVLNTAEGMLASLGVPRETTEERILKTIDGIGAKVIDPNSKFTQDQIKEALDVVPELIAGINKSLSGDTHKKAKSDVDQVEKRLKDIKDMLEFKPPAAPVDPVPKKDPNSKIDIDSAPENKSPQANSNTKIDIDSGPKNPVRSSQIDIDSGPENVNTVIPSKYSFDLNFINKFVEAKNSGKDLYPSAKGVLDIIDRRESAKIKELREEYNKTSASEKHSFDDIIFSAVREIPARATKEFMTKVFDENIADSTINTDYYSSFTRAKVAHSHLDSLNQLSARDLAKVEGLYNAKYGEYSAKESKFKETVQGLSRGSYLFFVHGAEPLKAEAIFQNLEQQK